MLETCYLKLLNAHLDAPHFHMFNISSKVSAFTQNFRILMMSSVLKKSGDFGGHILSCIHMLSPHEQVVSVQGTAIWSQHGSPGVYTAR